MNYKKIHQYFICYCDERQREFAEKAIETELENFPYNTSNLFSVKLVGFKIFMEEDMPPREYGKSMEQCHRDVLKTYDHITAKYSDGTTINLTFNYRSVVVDINDKLCLNVEFE